MIKANLIQLAIIVIAIIMGFLSIQYLMSFLITFSLSFTDESNYVNVAIMESIRILLISFLQLVICWIMIKKSNVYAQAISRRANINGGFSISTNVTDLLFIILIAIGLYLLVINLPLLITNIFFSFQSKVGRNMFEPDISPTKANWIKTFLNLLIPLILLMFARPISTYFAKNVADDNTTLEGAIDEINTVEETN